MRTPGKRELLGGAVVGVVRDLILSGDVRPGERLGLTRLSELMGMSTTPVRQALFQLSQDGWLVHEPHRGFWVAPLDRADLRDTYHVWAHIEGEIATRAVQRATTAQFAEVRALNSALTALEDHHSQTALDLNEQFHSAVHAVSGAHRLVWFADVAIRSVPLRFNEAFQSVPGWAEVNRHGHTPIVEAMEAGDAHRAGELMEDHFVRTGELLISQLDQLGLWAGPASAGAGPQDG
ncbi:GntR family transcriptional regulator [Nakamurella deserti]|uniref:GntR family transcriptional regulator n=1 Tax=Nakamurella deserti TaxID=2164074 RepID=UPI0014783C3B|nr:GntR family transcriptional regulator [Nakamurella deserti]